MNPIILLSLFAILLYLLSSSMLAVRLFRTDGTSLLQKPAIIGLGVLALLLHTALLYPKLFSPDGINLGFFNALSLVSWLIVLLVLVTAARKPVENLGIALFPLAALAILLEIVLPTQRIIQADSPWQLQMHILISILAYSLFTIAMVQAVLLAIQDRHLHNHQPGGFVRALPPLRVMEDLLFQIITTGFVLLTVSLITGVLFLEDIFARHLAHKTVLSIAAWVIFGILLWGRFRHGWRGRKAIHWTLWGFVLLMLAYFGSKLVLELLLKRPL